MACLVKIDSHTFARRISINAIHHSIIVRLKNLTALVAVLFLCHSHSLCTESNDQNQHSVLGYDHTEC